MKGKNIDDLRTVLFDEIDLLREGKSTDEQAKAVTGIAKTILDSAKIEMEYHEMVVRLEEETDYQAHLGIMPLTRDKADEGHKRIENVSDRPNAKSS